MPEVKFIGRGENDLIAALAMLSCDLVNARSFGQSMERIADSMSDGNRALVRKIDELEEAAKEAGERLGVTMKEKAELEAQVQALKDGRFPDWMLNRDDRGVVVGIHWGGCYYSAADSRVVDLAEFTDCFAKRKPGEPVFVLLGRDPEGAATIRFWADLRAKRSYSDCSLAYESRKLDEAREIADSFDRWRNENGSSAKTSAVRRAVPRHPED